MRHDFPLPLALLSQALIILGMSMPTAVLRLIFFPPVAYIHVYLVTKTTTGNTGADFGIGSLLMTQVLFASDCLLLSDPAKELKSDSEEKPIALARPYSFTSRLKWAVRLYGNRRGIGWNFRLSGLPKIQSITRWEYMRYCMKWLVLFYLTLDLVQVHERYNPVFRSDSPYSIGSQGCILRAINVLVWVLAPRAIIGAQYIIVSLVFVLTGVSEPRDWPPLFGSLLEAYTIRRAWSRTWHQLLQKGLRSHGRFVSRKLLSLSKHGVAVFYVEVGVAFLLSSIIHAFGDYMMDPRKGGKSLLFFLMQPTGIFLEETVAGVALTMGWDAQKRPMYWIGRVIGYIWVFVWFTFWMVPWVDAQVKAGLSDETIFPLSIWEGLWNGRWVVGR